MSTFVCWTVYFIAEVFLHSLSFILVCYLFMWPWRRRIRVKRDISVKPFPEGIAYEPEKIKLVCVGEATAV